VGSAPYVCIVWWRAAMPLAGRCSCGTPHPTTARLLPSRGAGAFWHGTGTGTKVVEVETRVAGAHTMTWKGMSPRVALRSTVEQTGVTLSKQAVQAGEAALARHPELPQGDRLLQPISPAGDRRCCVSNRLRGTESPSQEKYRLCGSGSGEETGESHGVWSDEGLAVHTGYDPVLPMTVCRGVPHERACFSPPMRMHEP